MRTNPIAVAVKAKGTSAIFHRAHKIAQRYGFTSNRIDQALQLFSDILRRFDCPATFPITATTLKRNSKIIATFLDQNIEFAVHGYTHVDYLQLSPELRQTHLEQACEVFLQFGITPLGFRSPYLSHDHQLNEAIKAAGFRYASNQPILWNALDPHTFAETNRLLYERGLTFYNPWLASERLSLPFNTSDLIEIPVSLPDDEILIERLGGADGLVKQTWLQILTQTHQLGELFTLQLHPERITLCEEGLKAVLAKARTLTPAVWFARLSEIAAWWEARSKFIIKITDHDHGSISISISAPSEVTILTRGVQVQAPTFPWSKGYQQVPTNCFTVNSSTRPFIGFSPNASPALESFLHEKGFIVEKSDQRHHYALYFDQTHFDPTDQRQIIAQIEKRETPLVRLGYWPNGAQSALAVTGDIDALTLWDYSMRLIGK